MDSCPPQEGKADDSPESWETVHVTPQTAERELAHITVSRCFVLHSSAGFGLPFASSSLNTAATTTTAEGRAASTDTAAGVASTTLPPLSTIPSVRGPKATSEAEAATTAAAAGLGHAPDEAASPIASLRTPFSFFGAYRHVRVIRNSAPCVIRCAAEGGPASPGGGTPANATALGVGAAASSGTAAASHSALGGDGNVNAHASGAAAPQVVPLPPCPTELPCSSPMRTASHSINDNAASPLAPPLPTASTTQQQQQQQMRDIGESRTSIFGGASSATAQQLQQLASAYARSAMRRVSKNSSRRSHTSTSTLSECVVFAEPLEIIADAALSFVDVVFAAHVSVRGQGPVQFVNCSFGHRTTSQLFQQFVSHPSAAGMPRLAPQLDGCGSPLHPHSGSSQRSGAGSSSESPSAAPATTADDTPNVLGLPVGHTLPHAMHMAAQRRRRYDASAGGAAAAAAPAASADSCLDGDGSSNSDVPDLLNPLLGVSDAAAPLSVLDIYGSVFCALNQCDLYGGGGGGSLVCHDSSHVSVTDSSFEGPSITWAAIDVRDSAESTIQYTNIQQVMGVGVLVTDNGRATVDSSVIERCGVAGVVATDRATVSLHNTGVEASVSGVCVSLSGAAEAQLIGCGVTTRFPLPHRAVGLMFIEHLQSLSAFKPLRGESQTSFGQESILSALEDPLLQHAFHADLESLLGLWLLHGGAADATFPSSSQSLVLNDGAMAVVTESEFTCTMRLPSTALSSFSGEQATRNTDYTTMDENPSSSGSHANRSIGAVPSFTGLPPAAASAVAVMFSSSGANISVNHHNNVVPALAMSAASATQLLPGVVEEASARVEGGAASAARQEGAEAEAAAGPSPPGGSMRNPSHGTVQVPARLEGGVQQQPMACPSPPGLTRASGVNITPCASTAQGPAPLYASVVSAGVSSPLPVPLRRIVSGLLSSYVLVREVFGEFLEERRQRFAEAEGGADVKPVSSSSGKEANEDVKEQEVKDRGDAAAVRAADAKRESPSRWCPSLFLAFEAAMERADGGEGAPLESVAPLSTVATASVTRRRQRSLCGTVMQSLQRSMLQLGCLPALMAPNGGVYHVVVSRQASLALSSSVLSLALPPQLMVTLPSAWASAAGFVCGSTGTFSSTIRTTAAPFVAAVLDYHEPPPSPSGEAPAARGGGEGEQGEEQSAVDGGVAQAEARAGRFCSIFTKSNVIQYECESVTDTQIRAELSAQQSGRVSTGGTRRVGSPRDSRVSNGSTARVPDSRSQGSADAVTLITAMTPTTTTTTSTLNTNTATTAVTTSNDEDDEFGRSGESSAVHSILGGGVSGHSLSINHNNSSTVIAVGSRRWPAGTESRAMARAPMQLPPPRPFSAAASTATHPRPQQQQQQTQQQTLVSSDENSSSNSVDFNTAAWGLVLLTPPHAPHSAALTTAMRVQAEHWCRVELTSSQSPTQATTQGDASVTDSSAATARRAGQEGPLGVPLGGAQDGGQRLTSANSSTSTRTAGGSTSVGCPLEHEMTNAARLGAEASGKGEGEERREEGDGQGEPAAAANNDDDVNDSVNGVGDAAAAPVHHLGNIFLNLANQAELLSVTHPEHVCTTFSLFAHVMELPAALDYPESPTLSSLPQQMSAPPPASLLPPPAAAATGAAAATAAVAGVGVGAADAAKAKAAVGSPAAHAAYPVHRVLKITSADTIDPEDVDAPFPRDKPGSDAGTASAGGAATSGGTSARSSPTTHGPHGGLPGPLLSEREMSRLHVNAEAQRQMLFDDVDAPPLLGTVAAAAAAAVRDSGDDASGRGVGVSADQPSAHASGLLRSINAPRACGASTSTASSKQSNTSTRSPERVRGDLAAAVPDKASLLLPLSARHSRDDEDVRSVDVTKVGPSSAIVYSSRDSPRSQSHLSSHRSAVAFTRSPTGAAVTAVFPWAVPLGSPTGAAAAVAVAPPSPPELDIMEVDSVTFSSSQSDSSNNSSSSSSSGSNTGEGEEGVGTGGSSSNGSHARRGSSSSSSSGGEEPQQQAAVLGTRARTALMRQPSSSGSESEAAQPPPPPPAPAKASPMAAMGGTPLLPLNDAPAAYAALLLQPSVDYEDVFITVESVGGSSGSGSSTSASSSSSAASSASSYSSGSEHDAPHSTASLRRHADSHQEQPVPTFPRHGESPEMPSVSNPSLTLFVDEQSTAALSAAAAKSSTDSSTSRSPSVPVEAARREATESDASQPRQDSAAHTTEHSNHSSSHAGPLKRRSTKARPRSLFIKEDEEEDEEVDKRHQHHADPPQESQQAPQQEPSHPHPTTQEATSHTSHDTEKLVSADGVKVSHRRSTAPAAVPAAVTAAPAAAPAVVVDAATQARMAQFEDQLLQMQRLILLQQTQMTQMHLSMQQSATSHLDFSALEMQPSLLQLPAAVKSVAGMSEHTNGTSKDSMHAAQSVSYRSSFDSSKLNSTATSQRGSEPCIIPAKPGALNASGAAAPQRAQEDGKSRGSTPPPSVVAAAGSSTAVSPPRPPLSAGRTAPNTNVTAEERRASARAEDTAAGNVVRVVEVLRRASDDAPKPPRASPPTPSMTLSTSRASAQAESNADHHHLHQPPQQQQQQPSQHEGMQPLEQREPSLSSASPVASSCGAGEAPPPAAHPHPPLPVAAAPQAVAHITPSPPLRPRARRRRSSGSTLQLLIAAAQQTLLATSPSAASAAAAAAAGPLSYATHTGEMAEPRGGAVLLGRGPSLPSGSGAAGGEWPDSAEEEAEELRWQQGLLRRLRGLSREEAEIAAGTADRWRDGRQTLPTPSPLPHALPRRSTYAAGQLHAYDAPAGGLGDWQAGLYGRVDDDGGGSDVLSSVAYEPWRTTVATGTRYAHRAPPHPYASPAPPPAATAGGSAQASLSELRWPVESPPMSPRLASPGLPPPRAGQRPGSFFVPYAESANSSSQLSSSAAAAVPPVAGGGGPQALYLSGRRASGTGLLRATYPQHSPSPPHTHRPSRPPAPAAAAAAAGPHPLSRFHEDHLHDQYARAAWRAVVAQSQAQERARERLSPPRQQAQVQRLYAAPLQERMTRAAAHAQPTREELFRHHGCTFTPRINAQRSGSAVGSRPARRPASSGGGQRQARGNAGVSAESLRAPSTLPSNNTTVTCDGTTASTSTRGTSAGHRRRRRVS